MRDFKLKPLVWMGSSRRDLLAFPADVRSEFGYGLYQAQTGARPRKAKTLSGFGGAGVVELVVDHRGDTFRAAYTVRFASAVYVLHAFQKKSKSGIATPGSDLDLIRRRLRDAEAIESGKEP